MANDPAAWIPNESAIRALVRDEVASLAGLALRRLQDEHFSRSFERNAATDAAKEVMGHFWGEVLAEYGGGEASWVLPEEKPPAIPPDYADSAE